MTFYVQKSLANGPVRFGVSPRNTVEAIDDDPALSTGASGEFLRRGSQGFFFDDARAFHPPSLPAAPGIRSTPFLQSLKPDGSPRGWGFLALMVAGAIFVLLGFAVIAKKGPAGWVEVVLGTAMIATPIVMTARRRRQIALREEKERAEREERERHNRATLETYSSAIDRLRRSPTPETIGALSRDRAALDLPYDIWSPLARRTVLQVGFDALSRLSLSKSADAADLISRVATAAGLTPDDEKAVRVDLYRVILWHLLADDRAGTVQSVEIERLREGFAINDNDVPIEARAVEQFGMLRGVTLTNLPRQPCTLKLESREYCIHATPATRIDAKGREGGAAELVLTNKRVVLRAKKPVEILLSQIDDVEVDADSNLLTIRIARPARPLALRVVQPIYTAALIDQATSLDERPRGFA